MGDVACEALNLKGRAVATGPPRGKAILSGAPGGGGGGGGE